MSGEAALPIVDLQVYPNGSGSAKPFIFIGGVKMDKISISHRPGTNLMTESWTFIGTGSIPTGATA